MKDQQNAHQQIFQEPSFNTISIDSTVNVSECVALAKQYNKTIQGNLDPAVLYGSDESIKAAVQ